MNAQTRKHTQTDTHTQRILFRAFLVKRYLNNKMWKTILNYNPVELNISDYIKQRNTHLNNTHLNTLPGVWVYQYQFSVQWSDVAGSHLPELISGPCG